MNAMLAAANATLPDQVPAGSRGKVSGLVGITTPIGILAGSFIVNFLPGAGSLEFPVEVIDHVEEIASVVPTVVDVLADRPAILEPVTVRAAAVTVNWGASGAALLDVLSGASPSRGRLPFDLPRSMAAVEASRPDVPFGTADPLFRFGHGLVL